MHPNAQKIQNLLSTAGCAAVVQELPSSTRTAVEAAASCGCELGQIVKSLVFQLDRTASPVLLLVSGSNRVNEVNAGRQLGGRLSRADAQAVQAYTGFAIGGIPPFGHLNQLPTWMDEDLFQYEVVWAAAGTPHAVFPIKPAELQRLSDAQRIIVK